MSILGSIGGFLSGNDRVKGFENAGNQVTDILNKSVSNTTYAPGGAQAFQNVLALVGAGGNPAATQAAFDNFLNSTGYQTALKGGNDAITSSMAATLGNKSGAADKARLRFGTGLANDYFTNFFNQNLALADRGQRADEFVSGGKADAKWKQYTGMGEARGARTDAIFSGIGDAVGAVSGMSGGNPWSNIWGG